MQSGFVSSTLRFDDCESASLRFHSFLQVNARTTQADVTLEVVKCPLHLKIYVINKQQRKCLNNESALRGLLMLLFLFDSKLPHQKDLLDS